jgi:predicted DNA-binding transcriptional regulator
MSSFDEFKKAARETVETIADRSVELYRIAEEKTRLIARRTRLSAEIAVEKGGVRNLYKEIGRVYYALHNTEPETALRQLCAEVDAAMERIEARQAELDELKNGVFTNADYAPDEEAASGFDTTECAGTESASEPAAEPGEAGSWASAGPSAAEPEAPQSGAYDAAPPEVDIAPDQDEWQKKYPPEFRL